MIDTAAFRRIIDNLLENCLKHSRGNRVTIRLFEQDQQVRLEIFRQWTRNLRTTFTKDF